MWGWHNDFLFSGAYIYISYDQFCLTISQMLISFFNLLTTYYSTKSNRSFLVCISACDITCPYIWLATSWICQDCVGWEGVIWSLNYGARGSRFEPPPTPTFTLPPSFLPFFLPSFLSFPPSILFLPFLPSLACFLPSFLPSLLSLPCIVQTNPIPLEVKEVKVSFIQN